MPGRLTPPMPDRLSPQWAISALTSVPSACPARGMDDEAGRLVEHEEMLVLEDDVERQLPAPASGESSGGGALDLDRAPPVSLVAALAHDRAVDVTRPASISAFSRVRDSARRRSAAAGRESGPAARRRRSAATSNESRPDAAASSGAGEARFRPSGSDGRRRRAGLAPGALFGLGIHRAA